MNNSIKYLSYLIVFAILFDFIFGWILGLGYFSQKNVMANPLSYSVIGSKDEIIIFGSSKALYHYNQNEIENSLNITCHNAGYNGQNIYFHLALLQSCLLRNVPKIVILDLMHIDFIKTLDEWDTDNLSVLLPYVNVNKFIRQAIYRKGKYEKYKLWSSIYPYNSQIYNIIRGSFAKKPESFEFLPLTKTWNFDIAPNDFGNLEYDDKKIQALISFIRICKENKINLHIFVSPHFSLKNRISLYDSISKTITRETELNLHNFEDQKEFITNRMLFADPGHLNKEGASLFTQLVINEIKKTNY